MAVAGHRDEITLVLFSGFEYFLRRITQGEMGGHRQTHRAKLGGCSPGEFRPLPPDGGTRPLRAERGSRAT